METDQHNNGDSKQSSPWWANIGSTILEKPNGLSIIFSLALLAIMLGLLPSDISTRLENIETSQNMIMQQHESIQKQVTEAIIAGNVEDQVTTKLLRGICIIMSKSQTEQLQYCNP